VKPYTTLQPTRTVMRTPAYEGPFDELPPIEVPGFENWIMIEPDGQVWTWDGWSWC